MNWDFVFAALGALLIVAGVNVALLRFVDGDARWYTYPIAGIYCLAGIFIASFGVS